MTPPDRPAISPSFIVSHVDQTRAFYRDKLGFATKIARAGWGSFFTIIGRDCAQIFVKSNQDVSPRRTPSAILA